MHPSGRPALQAGRVRRRKGRGSPPIPGPSPFTASGWRPDRSPRSGRGRRPPRRRSRRSERVAPYPLRGRMGRLCVQANLSTLARREQGEDGGGTPPKRRAGRPARGPRRTDRIQRGPRRSRALSGPPWSASGGWGSGRVALPVELEGLQGSLLTPWSWSRTGTMRPSRLLRKLAACRRVLVGLNKGEAHHALKRQLTPTRRTAGTEPGRGGTAGSPGLNLIAAREKAGAASRRCGLIDPEVPDLSAAPVWAAAACRRPAPALAPVPASALAPVSAPAPALA